jgi:hypothetical protein
MRIVLLLSTPETLSPLYIVFDSSAANTKAPLAGALLLVLLQSFFFGKTVDAPNIWHKSRLFQAEGLCHAGCSPIPPSLHHLVANAHIIIRQRTLQTYQQ